MDSFLVSNKERRMAFDMGARRAVSRENIASYVNEAGVCVPIEEAISVFRWSRKNGGVVCDELDNDSDISDYLDWRTKTSQAESKATLEMREQFLEGRGMSLHIMPPLEGVYNEGRGVLLLGKGERAELFGFRIRENFFVSDKWIGEIQQIVANPIAKSEQVYDSIRQTSFAIKQGLDLVDLEKTMPELAGIWQRIGDGRAREKFERLKHEVEPLVKKYEGMIKSQSREGYVRMGADMERDLGRMGMGVAKVSGCGFSNSALMGRDGMGGGSWGLVPGMWMEEAGSWKKPEKKSVFKDGKWREFVKIEKCGFHWKNGGSCTWEPNDFVEVGSNCPGCKRKFVCF